MVSTTKSPYRLPVVAHAHSNETELKDQIDALGKRIEEQSGADDERSRCAVSYLNQLLRDRRELLASVRSQKRRG